MRIVKILKIQYQGEQFEVSLLQNLNAYQTIITSVWDSYLLTKVWSFELFEIR